MHIMLEKIKSHQDYDLNFKRYLRKIKSAYNNKAGINVGRLLELFYDNDGDYEKVSTKSGVDLYIVANVVDWYLQRFFDMVTSDNILFDLNMFGLTSFAINKLRNVDLYSRNDVVHFCRFNSLTDIKGIGSSIANEIIVKLSLDVNNIEAGVEKSDDDYTLGYAVYNPVLDRYYNLYSQWVKSVYRARIYTIKEKAEMMVDRLNSYGSYKNHSICLRKLTIDVKEV